MSLYSLYTHAIRIGFPIELFHLITTQERFYGRHYTLANLSFTDLMAICASNGLLREIIGDFFHFAEKHEINIRIDQDFLIAFPIEKYTTLYTDFGEHTRSLTLCHLNEGQIHEVLTYFRKLSSLRLEDINIYSNKCKFMNNSELRSIELINCRINREFVNGFFKGITKTVEEVLLDGFSFEFPISGEAKFLQNLPQLKRLIVKNMKITCFDFTISAKSQLEKLILTDVESKSISIRCLNSENQLRHLEIETKTDIFLAGEFGALETLILKCGQRRAKRDHLTPLQCFDTLKVLEYRMPGINVTDLLRFKQLKQVIVCGDWWLKEEWQETLKNVTSLEIICQPAKEGYSLETSLNPDIIQKIIEYLTLEEFLQLIQVYPNFIHHVSAKMCLTVDPTFLKRYPCVDNGEFYQNLGEGGIKVLRVAGIKEEDFLFLMDKFRGLRDLQLEAMKLTDVGAVPRIPRVHKLSVKACSQVEESYWQNLLQHLNDGLKVLAVDEPRYPLEGVTNLRELSSDYYMNAENMSEFLARNSLKKLKLATIFRDPFLDLPLPDDTEITLTELEYTGVRFEQILPVLNCLKKEELKSLRISSYSNKGEIIKTLAQFNHLEELSLETPIDWSTVNLSHVAEFVHLKCLKIDGELTEIVLMDLIRSLPALEDIQFGPQVELFTVGLYKKLTKYLQETSRNLRINKKDPLSYCDLDYSA